MNKLRIELSALTDESIAEMQTQQEVEMSEDPEFNSQNATCCHVWTKHGENDKLVRDSNHKTGKYGGSAHDIFNIA